MQVKINEANSLRFDPEKGARIEQLTLRGRKIIQCIQNQPFLSSGSYLMFPWVNRILTNPYQHQMKHPFADSKGYPLHGLFSEAKRTVKILEDMKKPVPKIQISISNFQQNVHSHRFTEKFILQENLFEIQINVEDQKFDSNPYCFGYHPYFQMEKPLSELKIRTNLVNQLALQENFLMKWPKQILQSNPKLEGSKKYDSLFQGAQVYTSQNLGNFVELDDSINRLRIQSNLKYWQIYTPSDGKRIAIEPMSFHGNIYEIVKQNPSIKQTLPKSGKIRITIS